MTESEFFALIAERDVAEAEATETYRALQVARLRAEQEVGTGNYPLFCAAFQAEDAAYQKASNRAGSLRDRVRFVLASLERPVFVLTADTPTVSVGEQPKPRKAN